MERKNILWVLLIGLILSIGLNIIQLVDRQEYKSQIEFYDTKFASDFDDISNSIDLYGGLSLSEESAIKNSVDTISSLSSIYPLTSYKDNKELGQMLLNMKKFFVLQSNDKVKANISNLKEYLSGLNKDLNNKELIIEFNSYLIKQTSFPLNESGQ